MARPQRNETYRQVVYVRVVDKTVTNKFEGHACPARSEGYACHARGNEMDNPTSCSGPDEQVPPRGGRDKRVPPKAGPERHVPPRDILGETLSSHPGNEVSEGLEGPCEVARTFS